MRSKYTVIFSTEGGEDTNPEKTEALYTSLNSWVAEKEGEINFTDQKGVDEYWDLVYPNSLSEKFAAVLPGP